jgi:hypothetical protein
MVLDWDKVKEIDEEGPGLRQAKRINKYLKSCGVPGALVQEAHLWAYSCSVAPDNYAEGLRKYIEKRGYLYDYGNEEISEMKCTGYTRTDNKNYISEVLKQKSLQKTEEIVINKQKDMNIGLYKTRSGKSEDGIYALIRHSLIDNIHDLYKVEIWNFKEDFNIRSAFNFLMQWDEKERKKQQQKNEKSRITRGRI